MSSPAAGIEPGPQQHARLAEFAASDAVDVHCHCLPGLDDGPATLADALELCEALVADGTTTVIATPHQMGRYDCRNSPAQVRAQVAALNESLERNRIPLRVEPGADVRVDERTVELLARDRILTLADRGRHLLLELPHETFFELGGLLARLRDQDVTPIISHPERHPILRQRMDVMKRWSQLGAAFQVTAASLIGDAGPAARGSAWELAEAGLIDLIATDAHGAIRRPPCMTAAIAILVQKLTASVARRICIENPLAILQGRPMTAVRRTALTGGRA